MINRERPGFKRRKKERKEVRPQVLAALVVQPLTLGTTRSTTKDTKYLIYQKMRHWAKKCPNCENLKHDAISSRRQATGWHSVLWAEGAQAWGCNCLAYVNSGLKLPTPPAPPQENTITGQEPKLCMGVAGRIVTFLLDMGVTYCVFTSFCRFLSSQSCTILGVAEKLTANNFTCHLACLWDRYYFIQCLNTQPLSLGRTFSN